MEWEGNIITGHYGGVFITTENESKEIFKEICASLTIWNGNIVCGGFKVISIFHSNMECIMELNGHTGGIQCLVVWNELLVSGEDNTIRHWDRNGNCQRIERT